ncbi:MAG: hypothetical protein JW787_03370 [Sedimentisphaerales bacterium]|nr:hypothetical protein [Sedimentisphaerales bacterium]
MDCEYQFVYYSPEHKEQVLNVLEHLWPYDRSKFADFFRWKYENNPYIDTVLGVAALYQGRVVGFRGYFANRFIINDYSDNLIILHPGDTCVHPEHQRKGLSVSMGKLAFQFDNKQYPLFMNMTCGAKSLPGYIKMGFSPLEQKNQLKKYSLNPLRMWRYRQDKARKSLQDDSRFQFGRIGDFVISCEPLPEQMASVVKRQGYPDGKLCFYQDRSFFEWRYRNVMHKYLFYFLMKEDIAAGYVVLDVNKNNQAAAIIDYAQACDNAIETILRKIIESKCFTVLSVYSYGLDKRLSEIFSNLSFSEISPWRKFIPQKDSLQEPVMPLLVRPVKEHFSEQDFIIHGVNTFKFENWLLKPVCSDSA